MTFSWLLLPIRRISLLFQQKFWAGVVLSVVLMVASLTWLGATPAIAGLNDDRYDGDIFALYAGNGSLVPPKYSLKDSFRRERPVLLVFYIDDSSDCKRYSTVISQLQAYYGRAADFTAIRVDSLPVKDSYTKTEPAYYYKGVVPQTVLFDSAGKIVLDEKGTTSFEKIDDKFREVFDLLPRTESIELKRRTVNEISTELTR